MNENSKPEKTLLAAYNGRLTDKIPFWLMRQAGRYLPEYRDLRATAGGFLDLVFNPQFAAEVTLQPIRRFGMQGAILFSDILVVPHALGQAVRFEAGEGPRLDPLAGVGDLGRLGYDAFDATLAPIYETVRRVRAGLAAENFSDTALIGFAGAPWTVACYMAEGRGSKDFAAAKGWAYADPDGFDRLLAILVEATVRYLSAQIDAGVEAVKIFDSWAGVLDEALFRRCVIAPTRAIVTALRARYPAIPIIGFPRGAGTLYGAYAEETGVTALAFDQSVPAAQGQGLQQYLPVQGNLDPVCLLTGGGALDRAIDRILSSYAGGPFVFNLGHGVIKETPPDHVAQLATKVREWQRKGDAR